MQTNIKAFLRGAFAVVVLLVMLGANNYPNYNTINQDAPPAQAYSHLYDYDVNGNLIYKGWCRSGGTCSAASAIWAIEKFTYNGTNSLINDQWANGNTQENNVWNNRTGISFQNVTNVN